MTIHKQATNTTAETVNVTTTASTTAPSNDIQEKILYINGGKPLSGEVNVQVAKNSTLPIMLAALLTAEPIVIEDAPQISDVRIQAEILAYCGAEVEWQGKDLHVHAKEITNSFAPYHLVSKLRASFVAMGALLGRCGEARISMPGGCALGPRPVDRHIKAFKQLGIRMYEESGDFFAKRDEKIEGHVVFDAPTVTGTQNVMLASVRGESNVTIENAALEPEIIDLANMLIAMGANITGAGTSLIEINGVPELKGIRYRPIPDRIEAGTFMLAAAATRGDIIMHDVDPKHLRAVIGKLTECGVEVSELNSGKSHSKSLRVDARAKLTPVDITAVEYPGVPTDLQAPFGAFLATVDGTSVIVDKVYPERFTHVDELARAGAHLDLRDHALVIRGKEKSLQGARMQSADIRAGGALIVAAVAAEGQSEITGVHYIERGYENITERLRGLGVEVHMDTKTTSRPV